MKDILEDSQLFGQKYTLCLAWSYPPRWKSLRGFRSGEVVRRQRLSFPRIFNNSAKTLRADEWTRFAPHMVPHSRKELFFINTTYLKCSVSAMWLTAFLKKISSNCQWLLFNSLSYKQISFGLRSLIFWVCTNRCLIHSVQFNLKRLLKGTAISTTCFLFYRITFLLPCFLPSPFLKQFLIPASPCFLSHRSTFSPLPLLLGESIK